MAITGKAEVTEKVKQIISEQLGVEESEVTPKRGVHRRFGRGFARSGRTGDGAGRGIRSGDFRRRGGKDPHRAGCDRLRR